MSERPASYVPRLIAEELAALIEAGRDDPRLEWSADRSHVRILPVTIVGSGPNQTREGRRRRLRRDLDIMLWSRGAWGPTRPPYTYERRGERASPSPGR